jgi:S-adenosylmethionine uptake transporter
MGVCVKPATAHHGAGEIVMVRSLVGVMLLAAVMFRRRVASATPVPAMHF